ncbi:hypothetical protein [Amycolatopsis sp. YIM 10]|uniref:hypothetical protein n=1 Tax=Amycolatopsis sp. YIM 10 TaxID=2653857 RepID=UPI00351A4BA2
MRTSWVRRCDRQHGEAVVDAVKSAEFPAGALTSALAGRALSCARVSRDARARRGFRRLGRRLRVW